MKKILYISKSPTAEDRASWSGTVFQTIEGLKRAGYEVDYLYALQNVRESIFSKILFLYWDFVNKTLHKNTRIDDSLYCRHLYRKTLQNYDYSKYDYIVVPTHTCIVAALPKKTRGKVIFIVDAIVDSLFEYYTEFSNLIFHNYWEASYLCKKAYKRSDLIIASSNWCKQNAITLYGTPADKIEVIEFGANIDYQDVPALAKTIRSRTQLNVYWSGVNWIRKGGDVALQCCKELINRGYDVVFNITGLKEIPPSAKGLDFVKNYGFLNKNNGTDYQRLIEVMKEQDIFLFPSKAECSSIALCEANGFGLPCFVYDTGGTSNYVKNGANGYMLPISATGVDFADVIESCIYKNELTRLSIGAVKKYKESLNWHVWTRKIKTALDKL